MADPVQIPSQAPLPLDGGAANNSAAPVATPTPQDTAAAPSSPPDASAAPMPSASPAGASPDAAPPAAPAEVAAAPGSTPDAAASKPGDPEPTLLQQFDKDAEGKAKAAAEAKPAEAKDAKPADKTAEAKAPDAKPAEPAEPAAAAADPAAKPEAAKADPLAPLEYTYALPEAVKIDDALKGELHTAFDAFRADPLKGAQSLIDLHAKVMNDYAADYDKKMLQHQRDVFAQTRKGWANEVRASDEIGGAGYQTAMGAVARMRDLVASDMMDARKWDDGSPRKSQLDEFLETTGAGDHPVFLTMMHRFARYLDEAPQPPPNPRPTGQNNGRAPQRRMKDLYADGPSKT